MFVAVITYPGLLGCDSFHVTQQTVQVKVTDASSDLPVRGALIDFKRKYHDWWMKHLDEQDRNELWLARARGINNSQHVTDDTGRTTLLANVGTIHGGLFSKAFDASRDRVTGEPYLLRIQHVPTAEILDVVMVPGGVSMGDAFAVTVLSIGRGQDVTQEFTSRSACSSGRR